MNYCIPFLPLFPFFHQSVAKEKPRLYQRYIATTLSPKFKYFEIIQSNEVIFVNVVVAWYGVVIIFIHSVVNVQ